jgi:hypothetical protein
MMPVRATAERRLLAAAGAFFAFADSRMSLPVREYIPSMCCP